MRIFITGSTGFVGRNLAEYYSACTVYSYKRGNLKSELSNFNPNLIINCAAEIYDPLSMYDANVVLTRECLEWVAGNPQTSMIQIGSSSEYGPVPYASSEKHKINPVDMYQATKGMATLLCQGYARTYDLDITIARPYSVYGRYEKPHRLFPRLWKAFMCNIPMTLNDGYHDFIHIDDFVRGIDLLRKKNDKPRGDIVNFGSGIQYSNFEVLSLFEKVIGHGAPVEKVNTMAKSFESSIWMCDTIYAKNAYGFTVEYDLESGIKEFLSTANYTGESNK